MRALHGHVARDLSQDRAGYYCPKLRSTGIKFVTGRSNGSCRRRRNGSSGSGSGSGRGSRSDSGSVAVAVVLVVVVQQQEESQ